MTILTQQLLSLTLCSAIRRLVCRWKNLKSPAQDHPLTRTFFIQRLQAAVWDRRRALKDSPLVGRSGCTWIECIVWRYWLMNWAPPPPRRTCHLNYSAAAQEAGSTPSTMGCERVCVFFLRERNVNTRMFKWNQKSKWLEINRNHCGVKFILKYTSTVVPAVINQALVCQSMFLLYAPICCFSALL